MSAALKYIDNGGSAFPKTGSFHNDAGGEYDSIDTDGMSLRDWFAGRFQIGFEQACYAYKQSPVTVRTHNAEERAKFFAFWASLQYEFADAMIAARKGGAA